LERLPEALTSLPLTTLAITSCKGLSLNALTQLDTLRTLELRRLSTPHYGSRWQLPHLQRLTIQQCDMKNLTPLTPLSALEELEIHHVPIDDLEPLSHLSTLTSLTLQRTKIRHLKPLAGLRSLRTLSVGSPLVRDISPLAKLTQLKQLDLQCSARDLTPLRWLVKLEHLQLTCRDAQSLAVLANMPRLKNLDIRNICRRALWTLPASTQTKQLSLHIDAQRNAALPFVLHHLEGVRDLTLHGLKPSDLLALQGWTGLRTLDLSFTPTQTLDTTPLASIATLEKITLRGPTDPDLAPLQALPRLKQIHLDHIHAKQRDALLAFPALKTLYLTPQAEVCDKEIVRPLKNAGIKVKRPSM